MSLPAATRTTPPEEAATASPSLITGPGRQEPEEAARSGEIAAASEAALSAKPALELRARGATRPRGWRR